MSHKKIQIGETEELDRGRCWAATFVIVHDNETLEVFREYRWVDTAEMSRRPWPVTLDQLQEALREAYENNDSSTGDAMPSDVTS